MNRRAEHCIGFKSCDAAVRAMDEDPELGRMPNVQRYQLMTKLTGLGITDICGNCPWLVIETLHILRIGMFIRIEGPHSRKKAELNLTTS